MKRKVLIIGDSTCDLTPEMRERLSVGFMPLPVNVGSEPRKDMENVFPQEIFDYYKNTGKLCTTSAPNSMDYHEFWKPILEQNPDADLIHFHISSEMTSTFQASYTASQEYNNVYSIDTRSVSIGVALLILEACEMRDQGMSAPEIVESINAMKKRVHVSFVVESIEFLWKGGRCSNLAGMGASLLKLRPGIDMVDGKLLAGKKYRGSNPSVYRKLMEQALAGRKDVDTRRIFVANTSFNEEVNAQIEAVIRECQPEVEEVITLQPGCSICVHCGPGTIGVAYLTKE
ncbi:DegV family protein [Hominifimenecus sp. rT4P-3]|uniref:DegV family protein n=1 Tax=Hominifimenecus sp. rT4P-3 TaxID=3242979 RepID=UPI003DA1EB10